MGRVASSAGGVVEPFVVLPVGASTVVKQRRIGPIGRGRGHGPAVVEAKRAIECGNAIKIERHRVQRHDDILAEGQGARTASGHGDVGK